ncbi:MAG: glycoside hydrolase family 99-like domain-containing protein, partial [Anaerolineae bacterium]|nr:glycoside hydrolase family 99-like domain-containing protein [Anaerolineae bacterium]
MRHTLRCFIVFCFLLLATAPSAPALAQEPPVLAFYYAWFDQSTWSSGQSVDVPAQPYASTDPATIERHVAQAQGAGINAFVQSWYGPQVENNQTETNFRTLLDIGAARGFKAAVDLEVTSPFLGSSGAVTNAIATLMATHVQHPGYLQYQGKPVIFFWRQQQYSVDTWASIRNQVDPNHTTIWIAEGTDLAYQAVFDGHHLYSIAWAGSPGDELARWGNRVRSYEADNQVDRLWVATAMPGYNDTNLPRSNAFAVSRQGGDYLRQTWRGALASQPDMVIINSFNEWLEGTQLEPSASYGNLYLDVTRELVTELRGSPPPAPAPLQVAA